MLPWYGWAMLSALFSATFFIVRKKGLFSENSESFEATRGLFQAGLMLLIVPFLNFQFPLWLVGMLYIYSIIIVAGILCLSKALRAGELSEIAPLMNMLPVFLLFWGMLFLDEHLSTMQLGGIGLLMGGAYMLEVKKFRDILSPFRLVKSPYFLLLVFSMILLSFTAATEKWVLNLYSSPIELLFWAWLFVGINLNMYAAIVNGGFGYLASTVQHTRFLPALVALLSLGSVFCALTAVSMAYVSLVVPVQRMSTLLSTIVGGELFHEHHLLTKTMACSVMLVGVYLIL